MGQTIQANPRIAKFTAINDNHNDLIFYSLFTLAFIGFIATYLKIIPNLSPSEIVHAIATGNANLLKKTLYNDYSLGFVSLRYLTSAVAAIALYQWICGKRGLGHFLLLTSSLIMLLLTIVISSRLMFIMFLLTVVYLVVHQSIKNKNFVNIKAITAFIICFSILTILNYSRNINFYSSIGLNNPLVANFAEILSYLGAPFQGAISAVDHFNNLCLGSFLSSPSASHLTNIEPLLSTNSALLELCLSGDWFNMIAMLLVIMVAGSIMGHIHQYRASYLNLIYALLLYCCSELWRIYLFDRGIVMTITIGIVCSISIAVITQLFFNALIDKQHQIGTHINNHT